jgi:hypothetical protein
VILFITIFLVVFGIFLVISGIGSFVSSQKKQIESPANLEWWQASPSSELEAWWQANESKDAKIRALEMAVKSKNILLTTLQLENNILKQEAKAAKEPIRRGDNFYKLTEIPTWITPEWGEPIPVTTLNDPGKIMVLPSGASYSDVTQSKIGLKIEGELARRMMEPNFTTQLTIRNGKVIDWTQSYEDIQW